MNTNPPEISAILVARDSGADLRACVRSILKEGKRADIATEIIVVDNGSSDGVVEQLTGEFEGISVLRNDRNRGFGAAANQGFRESEGQHVLLINPDARLLEGSLSRLKGTLDDDPTAAIAAPTLVLDNGALQESPRSFYNLPALLARRTPFGRTRAGRSALADHAPSIQSGEGPARVDWVTGAAMLVRRDAMPAQGPFDERYFLYFEDVDLCRRMRATEHGVLFTPEARVAHRFGGASRAQIPWNPLLWQHALSGLLYLDRWHAGWWTLRSARSLARGASIGALRAGLLWAIATIALPQGQAITAALLGALLIPLRARPSLGRRPLPGIALMAAALTTAGAVPALWIDGQLSGPLIQRLGLWCLAGVPAVRLLDTALRRFRAGAARRGLGHRACLLAGDPAEAARVAQSLREQPEEGLHIAGFVPLDPASPEGPEPRLGHWKNVAPLAARLRVDAVLLCGSASQLSRMTEGVVQLRDLGIDPAFVLTDTDELLQSETPPELAGRPLLALGSGLGSQFGRKLAEGAERTLALLGLLLLLPLSPLILGAASLASSGAPLFRTQRMGRGEAAFEMFRLRSGPTESGDQGGGWLGHLLRWTHADELPQLVNVVRGDMALVGPRPVTPEIAGDLEGWQRARFAVRPGITGVWQLDRLRRWRLEQMITSDLLYVLRRSPTMDLRLLLQTLLGRRNP